MMLRPLTLISTPLQMPHFEGFDEQQLNKIFDNLDEIIAQPFESIVRQGETGNELFILDEGIAVVTRKTNPTDDRVRAPSLFRSS